MASGLAKVKFRYVHPILPIFDRDSNFDRLKSRMKSILGYDAHLTPRGQIHQDE